MYGVSKSRYSYKIAIQYNLFNSFHSSSTTINECYYKTLGIVRNASEKDIRSAYVQMAKKYHPDVNNERNSTEKFTSINEAYSILSDKIKKQKYDNEIGNHNMNNNIPKNSHKNWWDFNFYGNKQSTNKNDNSYSDFEFGRDFYGDFSRFSNNNSNPKNRKRKRDSFAYDEFDSNYNYKNNPYADYYYFYQQQMNNTNNNSNNNKKKYENIWTDFEFEFEIEKEFESEFNNDAFWRFLRNNNKKHRAKRNENSSTENNNNNNNNKQNKNKNNNEKIKEKIKHSNNNKEKEKQTEPETEKESKPKKSKKNEISLNDIQIDLDLTFLEAAIGCTKNITFNRNEICNACGGSSFESNIECIKCIKCDGKGLIYGYGNDFVSHKCINCNGRGYIFKNCTNCNGKSVINICKSLTITIPSGIRDNDRVRVSKQGHQYINNNHQNNQNNIIRFGHIWINCNISKHEHFIRINNDIHITMNIPYVLAVLGGSFVIPTIYGPNIIKILAGINTNDYECLHEKGIYDSSTNKKGNQYIHFIIKIPQVNELNHQQKQLLNQYAKLEKSPVVIKTTNNLKHFKKYGQKVQTYTQNNENNNDSDSIDTDNDTDNENENENEESYKYVHENDIYDDLKDLL